MLAKHEGMNEKSLPQKAHLSSPTLCSRVTRMLRRAQNSLHSAGGDSPTYSELALWMDVAEGTVKYWLAGKGKPTAEFLIKLLERIPEAARHQILDEGCRVWPTLEHQRLRADATVLSRLKSILGQAQGLVFIQGGSDETRTFLVAALGHSFLALTQRPHQVLGLDAHEPDWFVPVPGVTYLGNTFSPALLAQTVREHWPQAKSGRAQLFLLNAIWPAVPECQKPISALTDIGMVVVAANGPIKPSLVKKLARGPLHILTLAKHPESDRSIEFTFEGV